MKKVILAALLMPTAAMAHPGHHGDLTLSEALAHLVTHPDHAALILAVLGVGFFILRKVGR